MKFIFEDNLEHQEIAVKSVVDLFKNCILPSPNNAINPTEINIKELHNNIKIILNNNNIELKDNLYTPQTINHLDKITEQKNIPNMHFAIEMETGTGKTYAYIKTILELAKTYNFTKFIIVVPGVAIRNSVMHTLSTSKEHFKKEYNFYNYFEYDSNNISQLRRFTESPNIEICIINAQSFNSANNNINKLFDGSFGETPMSWIAKSNPVVIIDEPQANNGEATQIHLEKFNPVFKIEYSATLPKNNAILLYKFGPLSAYKAGLVKQIQVISVIKDISYQHNKAYINLVSIDNKKCPQAKVILQNNQGEITTFQLKCGDNLYTKSNNKIYDGYKIERINNEFIEVSNIGRIYKGESSGDDIRDGINNLRIEQTIKKHLEKMLYFKKQDLKIKVLSLFFIDKVANYRGENPKFKIMFEKAYNDLIASKEFKSLNMPSVNSVQGAYFSQDKNGGYKDSSNRETKDTKEMFDLIMKDKEKLLSLNEPIQFIFSHSAISVGWDNPNVFQICTLNETKSQNKKRQEIGRGLRLPVDYNGYRIRDKSINILSIITNEEYEEFAKSLQNEIKDECGENIGNDYISEKINKHTIRLKDNVENNQVFIDLWNRIKYKTKYNVNIDVEKFIAQCIKSINDSHLRDYENKIMINTFNIIEDIEDAHNNRQQDIYSKTINQNYPAVDILSTIRGNTNLSKITLLKILNGIDARILNNIFKSPTYVLNKLKEIIAENLIESISDGITYTKLDNQEFQWQEIFLRNEELVGEFVELNKSIYNGFIADSNVEKQYAETDEDGDKGKYTELFIKLPKRFYLKTPQGKYSPDFAICVNKDDIKQTSFIVETKSTNNHNELRGIENIKINCAKEHFKALNVDFKHIAVKI